MTVEPPQLTLPPAEAEWLRAAYAKSDVIVEYGCGGSTVIAAETPGRAVFSVESDRAWSARMADYFAAHPPRRAVHLHPVDIGVTGKWGKPRNDSGWRKYHRYPISVWDRPDFIAPDLVLIDGRFRAACFVTTMLRIERPTTVMIDDYADRERLHVVEDYAKPVEIRGRMARFELDPRPFPVRDMAKIMELFTRIG